MTQNGSSSDATTNDTLVVDVISVIDGELVDTFTFPSTVEEWRAEAIVAETVPEYSSQFFTIEIAS